MLRKEFFEQNMPGGVEHGLLDDALQLAHIARPAVGLEQFKGLRCEAAEVEAQLPVVAEKKVVSQLGHVVEPLAQGWHVNGDYIEAVVEVLSKSAFCDEFFEIVI